MSTNLKAIGVRQLMRQRPPGWLEELLLRFGARAAAPAVAGTASYVGGRLAERRRTRKKLGFAMRERIETYPMKSQAQRRFLHAVHPDIAEEFEAKTSKGKKLPEHAKKKYELPLGSRIKWGAKRWAKRAALVGGGALGGAAYVKTRRAKKEYDVLRSAGFTPQEASEIATAGVLGKYSLNYAAIRGPGGRFMRAPVPIESTSAPKIPRGGQIPRSQRVARGRQAAAISMGGTPSIGQAPGVDDPSIRGGMKEMWGGLQSGYTKAAPHVQEWLKKPTTRRLALAGVGGGYYLGRRKRKSEGYSLSYAKKEKTYPVRRAILGTSDMHTKDLIRTLQSHGGSAGFFGKAAAHELRKRGFSDQEIQKAMKKVYSLQGYSLYQQYKNNPDLMRAIAARDGVELDIQRYAIQDVLTGWQLGYKHGEEEAQGTRPAPGALRLGALMTLHGESYVLGRQKALTEAGMHGGARQSESFLETLVKSVDRLLGGEKNAEASQTTASA